MPTTDGIPNFAFWSTVNIPHIHVLGAIVTTLSRLVNVRYIFECDTKVVSKIYIQILTRAHNLLKANKLQMTKIRKVL